MKSHFFNNAFHTLCTALILTSSIGYCDDTENKPTEKKENIAVETRGIPMHERAAIQEERAKIAEEGKTKEQEQSDKEGQIKGSESVVTKALYFTSHNGVFHQPWAVAIDGSSVELEDGSIWKVRYSDQWKILTWYATDSIVIAPNHEWFSSYAYNIINQSTGQTVGVNLYLGPLYNGIFTYYIVSIDYYNRTVILNDGTFWEFSSLDNSSFKKWLPNDTVIIGINDGLFSTSNPNILINVNVNNYAIGNCFNY